MGKRNLYFSVVIFILFVFSLSEAKTLYVLSHSNRLYSFDIDYNNDQLVYRDNLILDDHGGYGPIDLAIDEESATLFVSLEACNVITAVDAETMTLKFSHQFSNLYDLTGIVYDKLRSRILGTLRDTNRLYIIDWDAESGYLSPEPEYVELENIDYVCGVELDGDLLYVSKYHYNPTGLYETVYMYDVSDDFELVKTIDMEYDTVGIGYNTNDDALYGGAFYTFNPYLLKYTEDPNTLIKKPVSDGYITGLTCDNEVSGTLFTTSDNNIRMWDTSGWTNDPNQTASAVFTYDNNNNDNVILNGLAGCVVGGSLKEKGRIQISVSNDVLVTDTVSPLAGDKNIINFTITVDPNGFDHTGVIAEVRLPRGLTLTMDAVMASLDPNAIYPAAFIEDADYSWNLGDIDSGDPDIVLELETFVTGYAQPNGKLISDFRVETSTHYNTATDIIDVGCWGGSTIYVDASAGLYGSGTSWQTAYKSLKDALSRSYEGCGTVIKVAEGTYKPYGEQSDAFVIPDYVTVEGGYEGYGFGIVDPNDLPDPDYRDIRLNKTVLSGDNYNTNVVVMGDDSTLDGFTVRNSTQDAIKNISTSDSVNIYNCNILNSGRSGISLIATNCLVENTDIKYNSYRGIDIIISGESVISETIAINNIQDGIGIIGGRLDISNSIIASNGSETDFKGLSLSYLSANSLINNCTVISNKNAGLKIEAGVNTPEIVNSIFWKNGESSGSYTDLSGLMTNDCSYCCFTDPNDPNSISTTTDQYNNLYSNPGFIVENITLNNFHLASNSPCIGLGDGSPSGYLDVDNEDRVLYTTLDIGADEYKISDADNICDFDKSGNIDLIDFFMLADCYGSSSTNDPNYNPVCNVETTNTPTTITEDDLLVFVENWLWEADWFTSRYATPQTMQMMMFGLPEPEIEGSIEKQELVSNAVNTTRALNILSSFPEFENKDDVIALMESYLELLENEYNE
jgi:hypothetical protein